MTHSQLIARLEQLTGPDEELAIAINEYFEIASYLTDDGDPTASVDAALELAEKILPGCEYEITTLYNIARVTIHAGDVGPFYGTDECCNVSIALCIAILRAHGGSKP